jgi:hypothetical protein
VLDSPFSEYSKEFSCPEFERFLIKVMPGPRKSMWLDYDKICDELWKNNSVLIQRVTLVMTVIWLWNLSGSKQSDSSEEEDNINADNDMQHGTWTKASAEHLHLLFNRRCGINAFRRLGIFLFIYCPWTCQSNLQRNKLEYLKIL